MNQRKMSSQAKSRMKAIKFKLTETEWRERATAQDRCKGHTDGTDLVHDLTDLRENIEIDTFDYNGYKPPKGKSMAQKWI